MRLFFALLVILLGIGFSCRSTQTLTLEKGVSLDLAKIRSSQVREVNYQLHFQIPEELAVPITGELQLTLDLVHNEEDLILDFVPGKESVQAVRVNGQVSKATIRQGHILIPRQELTLGSQQIEIQFIAGENALNRNEEYLYTLFVPNKAATAFPCFDQPNIKARYQLSLTVPKDWKVVTNESLQSQAPVASRVLHQFHPTQPISTYLFAFAAGKFSQIQDTVNGRPMSLYHRETDETKITRNAPEIFALHGQALDWLENYTGIPYPFSKFDFVLIPAFQFGGMEHPGNIFYRSSSLFLSTSATVSQQMSRYSLIAHETAHMWFGDLVTMDWFNDVWLKEVFANFMAAKIVHPHFPEVNHRLRFVNRHHPSAYGEDRSEGSHPIQQELQNLDQASLLYGRIIYQKAPVVMKQLEALIGEAAFQEGLQQYLNEFSFGNATWDDLIEILNRSTQEDLRSWSQAWVKEAGMPAYQGEATFSANMLTAYRIKSMNQSSSQHRWNQSTEVLISSEGETHLLPVLIKGKEISLQLREPWPKPDFILPNASENGYGYFALDPMSQEYLLGHIHEIEDELIKTLAWQSLWESFLRGEISPLRLTNSIQKGLPYETAFLGLASRLGYLEQIYWGFTADSQRLERYPELAAELWTLLENTPKKDFRKRYYQSFLSIAETDAAVGKLYAIWAGEQSVPGVKLSEDNYTTLAYELAVRSHPETATILETQLQKIENPDRKAAMAFIIPALSLSAQKRTAFFNTLLEPENRQKEPWVLTAIGYLHHPLRAHAHVAQIAPSLALVQELQQTGGIFFPKAWVSTTLSGHQSAEAAAITRTFLETLPEDYSLKLKNKIYQASDLLFRRRAVLEGDHFGNTSLIPPGNW